MSRRGPFWWLTNTAVVVAGQLVTCAALAVVGTLCVHTSVHAVVGQGALISVCRDTHTQRYRQWDKSKWALPAKRQNGTAETVWLTYTAVSTPLVAHGALAGVGTFGVVARLFGTASVSASGTFIYVCRKKTHTQTPKSYRDEAARESSFPFKNASLVKTINMFGLHDLCDLWCVNCVSSQSQTCDHRTPWASCTSTQRTRSHKERGAK